MPTNKKIYHMNIKKFIFFLAIFIPIASFADTPKSLSVIDIGGTWKFAVDPNEEGITNRWFETKFDDSEWKDIQAGKGWKEQGVNHSGFGWYRKKIVIPAEYRNIPMVLTFGEILYDDDVYFNGKRVGGLQGPYKFKNIIKREYAVPDALIKYGEENVIAVRAWGMLGQGTEGASFGLAQGPFTARFDPYAVMLQRTDQKNSGECDPRMFDISDGQHSMTFNIINRFDADKFEGDLKSIGYKLTDFYDTDLLSGNATALAQKGEPTKSIINIGKEVARKIYFAGRFKLIIKGLDATGVTLFEETQSIDRLSYTRRDNLPLSDRFKGISHDTPYGKLRLVDEIDCSVDIVSDEHPYMQSGFDTRHQHQTPGSPVNVSVNEILGKKARESECGWFAYRLGRGKLQARKMYLVRIEYPEDKPRYCPIEIQTGENYMDIGWKNGVAADNPYDNWPLSGKYQWFDAIIPMDEETAGTSGANGASSEHGIWIYFMNKRNFPGYFPLFEGGPAISRIRLYEIDPEKNAPVIRKPEGLPERIFMYDWERQTLMEPEDVVQYGKLMGYNTVAPVIMKWVETNYANPFPDYNSVNVDRKGYWDRLNYNEKDGAREAVPNRPSIHNNFLEATKKLGLQYVPRVEYGGSLGLPEEARAISADGGLAKPSRYADWCGNLLHPALYDDFEKLLDFLVNQNLKEYPQIQGILWRIRCDRMPISYSLSDITLFSDETGISIPAGKSAVELATWASSGETGNKYADWWHKKRAEFHARIGKLMRSYRPDLKIFYYNWDNDKFAIAMNDFTGWDFLAPVVNQAKTDPEGALNHYKENIEQRKKLTGTDYIRMLESGDLGVRLCKLPHHGLRPSLYDQIENFELLAPSNSLYIADNPEYLNYFRTKEGVAISNAIVYDESAGRYINPKYEGNEIVPGGPAFSMALELMGYFHTDARTLTFTSYTNGRGFADAHRRFAQAYLALPAIEGKLIEGTDEDVCIRTYDSKNGTYIGVASKCYKAKKVKINLPELYKNKTELTVTDLVTGKTIKASKLGNSLAFEMESGPMELNAFLVK
jgi:hypothetical protein